MTGRQLRQMISAELPSKAGSRISVQHRSSPLSLDQTLRQQGLGECAALSYVYVPVDILAAWKYLQGEQVEDQEFSLHGLTRIGGESARQLLQLPSSLQHLKLSEDFDATLHGVTLPAGLQTLTFGNAFSGSLQGVSQPAGLQRLTLGDCFDESLSVVTLPTGLQEFSCYGVTVACF